MSLAALHVVAGLLVLTAVLAQVFRPVAPDLGGLPDPARWFPPAHLDAVRTYRTPLHAVSAVALGLRLVVPLLVAFTRPGRRVVDRIVARVGMHRPARAAAAVILAVVVAADLAVLPLAFWAGFVHEGAWGFRTQGAAGWFADWLLATVPVWLAVGVLVLGGYWLASRLPRAWPPVGALVAGLLTVVVVLVAPLVLEPLRFNTEPLPDGPLRDEVERLVAASGTEVSEILVADASRRTTKHNAYVSGLGTTRRIVLYDTLVDGQPVSEVAVVVGHELGHDRNGDIPRGILLGAGGTVLLAYLLAGVVRSRVRRGLQAGQTDPRAAAVVLAVVVVATVVSSPAANAVSRRAEAAADWTALEITGDPVAYGRKTQTLAQVNLSHPAPPRWVYVLWSTHPPAAARLEMGERWAEAAEAGEEP